MDHLKTQQKQPLKNSSGATIEQLREAYEKGRPLTKEQKMLALRLAKQPCGKPDNYIVAPGILRIKSTKLIGTPLYEIKCVLKDENTGEEELRVISDSPKLASFTLKKIAKDRRELCNQATKPQKHIKEILDEIPSLNAIYQMPFFINHKVFFVDFFILQSKLVLKVDKGTRNSENAEQNELLQRTGVKIFKIIYRKDMSNIMKLYSVIAPCIPVRKKSKVCVSHLMKKNYYWADPKYVKRLKQETSGS